MEPAYAVIVPGSLACGLIAGWVMHRSDFCVTASFRDFFLFRDGFLLRMLALLGVASIVLFETGRGLDILHPDPFPLLGPPALTSLLGGVLFGVGMVLAGGCVVGSLYKMGTGSGLGLVALIGMIVGSSLYAFMHGPWRELAAATRMHPEAITLAQALDLPPPVLSLPLAALGGLLLYRWARAGQMRRPGHAAGHLEPWRAALILAGVGFASWLLVGMPLGITTSYAKLGAITQSWIWPEYIAQSPFYATSSLDYTPPIGGGQLRGGPGPALDAIAAIQYPLILGIVLGAFLSAHRLGEFHLRLRVPPRQLVSALLGGVLLGLAARMVPGCNIWHLWGGLPILALQSLLFLAGLLPGAWLGSRILVRHVIR